MEESNSIIIDEIYEFSAPRFFDFINGETEADIRNAELWFETALSYAPSPIMLRIKTGRNAQLNGQSCDFSDAENTIKVSESSESTNTSSKVESEQNPKMSHSRIEPAEMRENMNPNVIKEETNKSIDQKSCEVPKDEVCKGNHNILAGRTPLRTQAELPKSEESTASGQADECTPTQATLLGKGDGELAESKRRQTAKKIASLVKNPSLLKSKNNDRSKLSPQTKSLKPASVRRDANLKSSNTDRSKLSPQTKSLKPATVRRDANSKSSNTSTPNLMQENQAIKRQKLEGGRSRQILNIKAQSFPHKSRLAAASSMVSNLCSSTNKNQKDRKIYVREPASPFVSMAEMMNKFQCSTREISLPQNSVLHGKSQLTLTRPKQPELETAQRVRSLKVKSSTELEEELMAKMPKFKARPLNRKILEAPSLPAPQKTVPQPPEFQEFHLKTLERANKNVETSSIVLTDCSHQTSNQWKPHLTEPKTPLLQTSLRARPPKVKSSVEIEQEDLEKIPKFKARPLNKKIFESKGDLGLFCNIKKQVTIPQEFHFAVDERIPPPTPANVTNLFDKLSLNSEPNHDHQIPSNTKPNPFHLHTEERGAEKEKRLLTEITQKQLEEERARIPKANPYPYTTDYPVIPPKPEPKQCTRPEPFQLESLVRHEEEIQREMEERRMKEREEAQMRIFKAQPILNEDPIPLPEKERKPLTQVQEFNLHIEHRAVDRAEFDKKVKEKEIMYKRYREEAEAAKLMEEEKALKQLRRTLVPHARPVPNFANPFVPQKACKEATKAKSPNLRILWRKERQKSHGATSSTAAAKMR
ncbi:hypothetical protein Ancab_007798 [Ancistrocladus abbreviatus]